MSEEEGAPLLKFPISKHFRKFPKILLNNNSNEQKRNHSKDKRANTSIAATVEIVATITAEVIARTTTMVAMTIAILPA